MKTDKQPILSLCIPTNGASDWVLPTVKSILLQDVDISLYEIVVVDNGGTDYLADILKGLNSSNLKYFRSKEVGFNNLVYSLKLGSGVYCKMLNHRSCLKEGCLAQMIDTICKYRESCPILYFSDGRLSNGRQQEFYCKCLNDFISTLHYYTSWSAGIGVWHSDIPLIEGLHPNDTFPQLALMFDLRETSGYVIIDYPFQNMQPEYGKGGYDLFYAFAVEYLNLIHDLVKQGRITVDTFNNVREKLFDFLCDEYTMEVLHKSKNNYIVRDVSSSVRVYYGLVGYIRMWVGTRWNLWYRRFYKLYKKLSFKDVGEALNR